MTKEERNARQRIYRAKNKNRASIKYESTVKGFLMRMYRNMKSRIDGVQKHNAHLYEGKCLMPKNVFYEWASAHPDFQELWKKYVESGYDRNLAPSPDRINTDDGYHTGNLRFITALDNALQGLSEWRQKRKTRRSAV